MGINIIDQISQNVKDKNILSDGEFLTVDPSLNNSSLIEQINNKSDTNPSPNILVDVNDIKILGATGAPTPVDMRVAQDTGRLIHNWWVYYLKSLKKFLGDSFDDSINKFEFNYSNKGVLLKKLYKEMDVNNPSCIINMNSFRTDSNLDPQRRNSGFYNLDQTTPLATNYSKNLDVRVDFKFVNITHDIVINFDDATDVLNYYDRFTTVYPLNIEFISYEYKTLINIHDQTKDWDISDDTNGIIYDAAILGNDSYAGKNQWPEFLQPQRWAQYVCCPQFNVQSIDQLIDRQSQKYSLRISLNTLLRVPQTLITRSILDSRALKAIQIVIDIGTQEPLTHVGKTGDLFGNKQEIVSEFNNAVVESINGNKTFYGLEKPICIDIDRQIYTDYKMENVLYLSGKINFDKVNGKLILPQFFQPLLQNKAAALYIIQDSTITEPELFWLELGYLHTENTDLPQLNLDEQNLINDFTFEQRSDSYLKNVGIDLDLGWKPGMLDENQQPIPEPLIDTLEINLLNYDTIKSTMDNVGPWFDVRLFLFNITDKGLIYG